MARYLYVLYLPLLARLVESQFTGSSPICADACYIEATAASACNTNDYNCFCHSTTFQETYTCCVRASCDSTNAESIGVEARALCASLGVAVTALPASACSSTFGISSTTSATRSQSTFTTTGTISHDTVTATATVTQQASGNGNSNSASASTSTGGTVPLESSSTSSSSSLSQGSGLSTGAKAGIGAGVGAGVLIILCVLFAVIRKNGRRKHKPEQPVSPAAPLAMPETPSPGGDRGTSWVEYKNELDASQKHKPELDEGAQVSKPVVYELPPADPAATLTKPWNELHADPVFYHQLPTGENASELP